MKFKDCVYFRKRCSEYFLKGVFCIMVKKSLKKTCAVLYHFKKMNELLYQTIFDAAIEVHRTLGGPGLLESVYESALCHELSLSGVSTQRQLAVPVMYKNTAVREPLFLDILVENQLIIEVKATGKDYPIYQVQLETYLRLTGIPHGLLINFGKTHMEEGICKVQCPALVTAL
jgi:GxxExxY protein